MHTSSCSEGQYAFVWTHAVLLLAVTVVGLLSGGCFVLTSERRNKPDAPGGLIKVHRSSENSKYSQLFEYPDFNLDVGAQNSPDRWQIGFLFYVLPIPQHFDYLATQPVRIDVHLEPKSTQIAFDPWRVFFLGLGTNQVRVPPAGIWQDHRWLGTNISGPIPITNDATFYLEFSPWSQMFPNQEFSAVDVHPDRDLPFRLSIEGIRDSGESVTLPSITFRATTFIRPGFRLPY